MEREVIVEIWQAFCTLSDAQEMLPSDAHLANGRINHAKRHLQGLINKTMAEDPDGFRNAVMSSMACTLKEGGDDGHRVNR